MVEKIIQLNNNTKLNLHINFNYKVFMFLLWHDSS